MILKDIHFDIQYIPNKEYISDLLSNVGYNIEEATRKDYELHWKNKRFEFRNQSQCITEMFLRLLYKMVNSIYPIVAK